MSTDGLPAEVVAEDQRLDGMARTAQEQLARLRWHWTLDETNQDRVTCHVYAKQVGRTTKPIQDMAEGYAAYIAAEGSRDIPTTALVPSLTDHIALAHVTATKAKAAQLIADACGIRVSNVLGNRRNEIATLIAAAEDSAARRGTTVDTELERHAEIRAKAASVRAKGAEQAKARKDLRYIELEGDTAAAMRHLTKVLAVARNSGLDPEHVELITNSLANLRALLGLIDMALVGSTSVDWDAELAKLGGVK